MKKLRLLGTVCALSIISFNISAITLIEDFEDPFPSWESDWLGINSNLENYYGVGEGRGNNPDGLWIDDGDGIRIGDTVEITFDNVFGSSLTSFAIDIAPHISDLSIQVYDSDGAVLLSSAVSQTSGATSEPGTYDHLFVSSSNGISGFSLLGVSSQIEGNVGIDNVVVTTSAVPVPAAIWLFGSGLLGLIGMARCRTV